MKQTPENNAVIGLNEAMDAMKSAAVDLARLGGDEARLHANELLNARNIIKNWIKEIRKIDK